MVSSVSSAPDAAYTPAFWLGCFVAMATMLFLSSSEITPGKWNTLRVIEASPYRLHPDPAAPDRGTQCGWWQSIPTALLGLHPAGIDSD